MLAVDLPGMTIEYLQKRIARCDRLTGVVPELDGRPEPLAAIYPKRCHAFARDFVARSRRVASEFAETCLKERAVRPLRVAYADAGRFANWNNPADLAASGMFLPPKKASHVLNS